MADDEEYKKGYRNAVEFFAPHVHPVYVAEAYARIGELKENDHG